MSAASARSAAVVRLAIEVALAACAVWLVIQNTLLLALEPWATRPAVLVAAAAILKALGYLVAAAWPLILFISIAFTAFVLALVARWAATGRFREAIRAY